MEEIVTPVLEVKEGIEGIKRASQEVKEIVALVDKALEDGIQLADVEYLPELLKNAGELGQAIKQARVEVQDLDASEVKEVIVEAIDLLLYVASLFGHAPVEVGEVGIGAVMDAIQVSKEIAKSIKEILADGKIGVADIRELPTLLSSMNTLFSVVKKVGPELKDLDAKELKTIAVEMFELVLFVIGLLGLGVK